MAKRDDYESFQDRIFDRIREQELNEIGQANETERISVRVRDLLEELSPEGRETLIRKLNQKSKRGY